MLTVEMIVEFFLSLSLSHSLCFSVLKKKSHEMEHLLKMNK